MNKVIKIFFFLNVKTGIQYLSIVELELNPNKNSWSSYPLAFSSGLTIPIPSVADPLHFGVDPDPCL